MDDEFEQFEQFTPVPVVEPLRRAQESPVPLSVFVAHNRTLAGISGFQFYATRRKLEARSHVEWHEVYSEFTLRPIKG